MQRGSLVNCTKYLREKGYRSSIISFRAQLLSSPNTTLTPKPNKDITKKTTDQRLSQTQMTKPSMLTNWIQGKSKEKHTPWPSGIHPDVRGWFHILRPISGTHRVNRLRKKSHKIIPIDGVKAFVKILHPFRINSLSNLGTEGNFLDLIKIYKTRS